MFCVCVFTFLTFYGGRKFLIKFLFIRESHETLKAFIFWVVLIFVIYRGLSKKKALIYFSVTELILIEYYFLYIVHCVNQI